MQWHGRGDATRLIQPRIVLDTNILVSALLFGGASLAWLVEAWHTIGERSNRY